MYWLASCWPSWSPSQTKMIPKEHFVWTTQLSPITSLSFMPSLEMKLTGHSILQWASREVLSHCGILYWCLGLGPTRSVMHLHTPLCTRLSVPVGIVCIPIYWAENPRTNRTSLSTKSLVPAKTLSKTKLQMHFWSMGFSSNSRHRGWRFISINSGIIATSVQYAQGVNYVSCIELNCWHIEIEYSGPSTTLYKVVCV